MEFQKEHNRIYLQDENGRLVAEVTFPKASENIVEISRTFVDESLRGQGIAGKLILATANTLREDGRKVVPTCSYAKKWFEKNPEYQDILAQKS